MRSGRFSEFLAKIIDPGLTVKSMTDSIGVAVGETRLWSGEMSEQATLECGTLGVQAYLRSGKTLGDLGAEFGIKSTIHPELPLVIVNYDQLESPKTHPIVRECRGLTLDTRDWSIVARGFSRFFNWGEVADEMGLFDFSDFLVQTKEDGSLCLLYNFEGKWHVNTRGSFAHGTLQGLDMTWREGIAKALGVSSIDDLNSKTWFLKGITYVCEFCSPWNKVVRRYVEPTMYLLSAFSGHMEMTPEDVDELARDTPLRRPERFEFESIEQIQDYLATASTDDPTYEGVVICDRKFRRWKIKNPTYLALHRLKGEGDNLFHPKHLLPFILAGEESELLTYFPEVEGAFYKAKGRVCEAYARLVETWAEHRAIESQKEFAQAIIGKTPFTSILFRLRKELGASQTIGDLKRLWREEEAGILKLLF
jgi:hypothetical protein